eukprot:2042031-Prymnesium_polylepis.3
MVDICRSHGSGLANIMTHLNSHCLILQTTVHTLGPVPRLGRATALGGVHPGSSVPRSPFPKRKGAWPLEASGALAR